MHLPSALLALIAGLLLPLLLPRLWPFWWLLPVALLVSLLCWYSQRGWRIGSCVLMLCAGLGWSLFQHGQQLQQRLPLALDNQRVSITGRVAGLPEPGEQNWRFQLTDAYLTDSATPLPALRVNWFRGEAVATGEWWQFEATLRRPRGMSNPGGFDYEAWLFAQGIGALASISHGVRLQPASAGGFAAWRFALRERLSSLYAAREQNPRVLALITGDRSVISDADWQVLQATGTSHLMVISGLHVGLLAAGVFALFAFLCRWGRLPWPWPRLWLAAPVALLVAAGYCALAGFAVPTQRALGMVMLVTLSQLLYRSPGIWTLWLLAFTLVLLVNPAAPLRAGFWLSFMAVATLLFCFAGRLQTTGWWNRLIKPQWVIFFGLWPWLMLWGMPLSLSSPLVNLLAIPWVGLLVVPLALLGCILYLLADMPQLLWLAAWCLNALFDLLALVAQWQGPQLLGFNGWLSWALLMAGVLMLLSPLRRLLCLPALGCLLLLWFPARQQPAEGEFWMTVLDVGQGTSVLLQTREHALLYDAGARYASGFDLGEAIVHPALLAKGVRQLDLLLVSHADNDHAGGAPAIKRSMPVARILAGQHEALPAGLAAAPCQAGDQWTWDGVRFVIVYSAPPPAPSNERSCVLRVIAANGSAALLPGDLGIRGEYQMLDRSLKASIILAPHHGSRSSSSYALIRAVAPDWVIYNSGHNNRFGHPHPKVVERYQEFAVEPVYTARAGAVRFRLGRHDQAEQLWGWRARNRRFWHEP